MENKKKSTPGWFWLGEGKELWQFALVKYVDYVDIFKHMGLSPAALCAATLWGGIMAWTTAPEERHWQIATYFKVAGGLCLVSVIWNTAKALWFSKAPSRTFWSGMSEFFGLLTVAGTRQPVSFLLAGNATAWRSPVYPWVIGYFLCIMTLNLRRQLLKRQRELARERERKSRGPADPYMI
jgi:predicted membrane channel-forming protein YqfA (hemolysin III family)